jgi:hypothetical protein
VNKELISMALIECKECRRIISSTASACPGCGHPQNVRGIRRGRWKLVTFFSAAAVALTGSLYKISTSYSETKVSLGMRVKGSSPVCRDESIYNNIITLIEKNDRAGAEKELNASIANNQCQILEVGQQITIQKNTLIGLPCVRWNGEPQCWYISPTLIELIP